jgi:hypothetical protein
MKLYTEEQVRDAMKNTFEIGKTYQAVQKMSRLALAKGHCPLYYDKLVYVGFEHIDGVIEHSFTYEGELRRFDDEFVNNNRSEDNSITIG